MPKKPLPRSSRLMASVHETAEGLHEAGVMDTITLRQFDELCLTQVKPLQPEEIPVIARCGNLFADLGRPNAEEALARIRLAQQIAESIERKD